jgi:hypothetical protein
MMYSLPMVSFLLATVGHAFSPIGKPANRMTTGIRMTATATPVDTVLATVSAPIVKSMHTPISNASQCMH